MTLYRNEINYFFEFSCWDGWVPLPPVHDSFDNKLHDIDNFG